jgi:3'-phosphoadenosine 5'-phosphosulfate sulfotransferase (PAPS reductase)/FAD synthetase
LKPTISALLGRYRCVVCYSGGKDSTVLLHLALQINRDVDVWHWDHGSWLMPRSIESQIIQNARVLGVDIQRGQLSLGRSTLLESETIRRDWSVWYRAMWGTLSRVRRERGWERQLVGLRSEEGKKRAAKIRQGPEGEAYPLAAWTWRDTWAYIIAKGLPYLHVYDRYARLLGYDKARLVTFFDMEFEKYGSPYVDGFLIPHERYRIRRA